LFNELIEVLMKKSQAGRLIDWQAGRHTGKQAYRVKDHRYLRKVDCSSYVMHPLLVLALSMVFLMQPLTVLTRQKRQVVCAINCLLF